MCFDFKDYDIVFSDFFSGKNLFPGLDRGGALMRAIKIVKGGVIFLPGVYLNEDDYNFDIALRRFKKQVEKAGILSEMKKRQHYEKPSVMRKKKKAAARKRLLKKMRKMNMA